MNVNTGWGVTKVSKNINSYIANNNAAVIKEWAKNNL